MIVDDILFNIQVLKSIINSENVTYIEAYSGAEALAKLSNEKPDIIFMDIRMPGISGMDVTEILKRDDNLKNIPVIAFTASSAEHKTDKIDQIFDGFLQKPIFKKDIDAIIVKYLEHSFTTEIQSKKQKQYQEESIEIHPETEKILPVIIDELENTFMKKWEQIKDDLIIYEIEEFKNQLGEFAFQNSCKIIGQYFNELNIGIQTFDIELIENKLAEFPVIVKKLKTFVV